MAVDSVSGADRLLGQTKSYDAVFTDKNDNATVKPSDFLNLMIAQMRNQDFLNPMDDTQFVTQMAQFSTMQQMMELSEYSKSNYAMALVGKTVTASRFTVSGGLDTTTGIVQKISLVDNEYILYVDGKRYTLAQVMEVQTNAANKEGEKVCIVDPSKIELEADGVTKNMAQVTWKAATEDPTTAKDLAYTVYYSEEGPFKTLADVKAGTVYGVENRKNILEDTLVFLEPGKTYYVNVVVKDIYGAEAVYQPVKVTTKAE